MQPGENNVSLFQLTRPSRGATTTTAAGLRSHGFQLTRPSRGATGDSSYCFRLKQFQLTRPSRGATFPPCKTDTTTKFQLTRPSRGATPSIGYYFAFRIISTHTPLAGRDNGSLHNDNETKISTHTPLAGRDLAPVAQAYIAHLISTHTPLAGRDEKRAQGWYDKYSISTHTPLAGRDITCPQMGAGAVRDFNSHAPRGARRAVTVHIVFD